MIGVVSTVVAANNPQDPNASHGNILSPDSRPNSFTAAKMQQLAAMEGAEILGTAGSPRTKPALPIGFSAGGAQAQTAQGAREMEDQGHEAGNDENLEGQQNAQKYDDSDEEDEVQQEEPAELLLPDEEIQALVQKVFTYDLIGEPVFFICALALRAFGSSFGQVLGPSRTA